MRHPTMEELTAFGLGHLLEAQSEDIELHLTDCEACRQKLHDVPDDALVRLLQESAEVRNPGSDTYADRSSSTADTDAASRSIAALLPLEIHKAPFGFAAPRELEGHPRYLVLGPIGAGGMGAVYMARHRLMERNVALKIVNPFLVNKPGAAERFTREVKAAAQLAHPNIVTAFDAEKVGDIYVLVMEYVDGQTLAQVLIDQPKLPIAKACQYIRQTAIGLEHALKHGMVHRDIKPQNLMLTRSGEIKILDFGLARIVREQTGTDGTTKDGTLLGSPDYMAPEQGHDPHSADTRADIYAMGCTLYHLLTGQVPFPATSLLGKLESHRDQPAIALHFLRGDVPAELAHVVEKMMAKDPGRRYQTPEEVVEALQPFAVAEPASKTLSRSVPGNFKNRGFVPLRSRTTKIAVVALGLTLAGIACWAATIVLRVETPRGTLIVKSDDPDVQLAVKSGGNEVLLFFPKSQKEVPLSIGQYTIELVGAKDGLKLSTNKFEITSVEDQKTVAVEFLPAVVTARASRDDADRRAAEYVLSIGGKVRVNTREGDLASAADLPDESFRLTAISLSHNPRVNDAGLTNIKNCKHLTHLNLGAYMGDTNSNVSDKGVAQFQNCQDLTVLSLGGTQVSDTGVSFFKDCKKLFYLHLDNTKLSDAGLANFQDMYLGALTLSGTQVTDAGLAYFADCKDLYWLWLANTKITDAGLAHFKDCKGFRYLILDNTAVSDASLAHFKEYHNLSQLWLDYTQVSDAGLAELRECTNLQQLHLTATKVSDAGVAHIKECRKLKELFLENTQVSDASLVHLKEFRNLEILKLANTKISAAGIAELKQALANCKFE